MAETVHGDQPVTHRRTLILGHTFVAALQTSGLLPADQRILAVTITARCGDPIVMEWEAFGDDRLLDLAGTIQRADSLDDAKAR
jgi:hypothetical protein